MTSIQLRRIETQLTRIAGALERLADMSAEESGANAPYRLHSIDERDLYDEPCECEHAACVSGGDLEEMFEKMMRRYDWWRHDREQDA